MIEAEILLDAHHARRRVDRDRECRLARERAIVDHADNDAVDQLQRDRAAVGQGQWRIVEAKRQRIGQRTGRQQRTIGAERRIGVDHRTARVAAGNRAGAGDVEVVALGDAGRDDHRRTRGAALVERHRRIGIQRRVH